MAIPVNPNMGQLDFNHIFQRVFDEVNDRLRVEAIINTSIGDVEISLLHTEDSVRLGDGTSFLTSTTIGSDVGLDVNIIGGSITANIDIDAASGDNIAISSHPAVDQIFNEGADTLTTTGFEEIYSYTSTDSGTRLIAVHCTSGTASIFRVKINGVTKREVRNSPLERNVTINFLENRQLIIGDILSVDAQVERLIQPSYNTFVAIEGYLI